ncbi:multiple sugar transport system substrate-binding protein [Marmoricola sp. OAE513]|uniref:extracellular solute-binding protein n=1 Tax=Marmoricola sp. OAE513 TaxID=2817894 RepID=UPI001AE3F1E0
MPGSPPRTAAVLLALGLTTGLLTSCGSDDGRVRITWYANPDQGGQAAVAKKCSTDKVEVEIQVLPQDAGQQRIQLARRLAAKDPGIDLMSLDPVFNAEFANAGFLAKIPDALQQQLEKQSFTGAVDAATWDDELVALPFWSNTQLLWYRKDAAKAAGLDMTRPVTWEQVIDAATRLNSENRARTTHVGVQANKYEGYVVWINALIAGAGGSILRNAEKGTDATIDIDSDPGRAAAKVVEQLAGSTAAEPDLSVSNEGTVLPFLYPHDRKAVLPDVGGFLVDWTFVYSNFKGLVGKSVSSGGISKQDFANLGWAPYPQTVAGKDAAPPYGGINIGVSQYSAHPDEAMEAAACIVEPDNQGVNADLTGNMPASAAGYDYPALRKTYPADLLEMLQAGLEAASPRPASPYWSDISGAIQAVWHSPRAVDQDTPAESGRFIVDVLKGRRLL